MLVNSGRIALMNLLNNIAVPGGFFLALFSNNYTVIATTTIGDLTPVPFFADQSLTGATGGVIVAGPLGQSTYNPTTHTNGGGSTATIYGWYVYDVNHGTLWAAGNFTSPITVAGGASITLNPFAQDDTL